MKEVFKETDKFAKKVFKLLFISIPIGGSAVILGMNIGRGFERYNFMNITYYLGMYFTMLVISFLFCSLFSILLRMVLLRKYRKHIMSISDDNIFINQENIHKDLKIDTISNITIFNNKKNNPFKIKIKTGKKTYTLFEFDEMKKIAETIQDRFGDSTQITHKVTVSDLYNKAM